MGSCGPSVAKILAAIFSRSRVKKIQITNSTPSHPSDENVFGGFRTRESPCSCGNLPSSGSHDRQKKAQKILNFKSKTSKRSLSKLAPMPSEKAESTVKFQPYPTEVDTVEVDSEQKHICIEEIIPDMLDPDLWEVSVAHPTKKTTGPSLYGIGLNDLMDWAYLDSRASLEDTRISQSDIQKSFSPRTMSGDFSSTDAGSEPHEDFRVDIRESDLDELRLAVARAPFMISRIFSVNAKTQDDAHSRVDCMNESEEGGDVKMSLQEIIDIMESLLSNDRSPR